MNKMANPKNTILCALRIIGDAKDSKRIAMFQKLGFEVKVIAFQREYHQGKLPNCEIINLGTIKNGKYFQRIFKMISHINTMRAALSQSSIVYCTGPDIALFTIVSNIGLRIPMVLEVGDLRKIQVIRSLFGLIVNQIDKFVVRRIKLLIVTAPGFIDSYYKRWLLPETLTLLLENKLEKQIVGDTNYLPDHKFSNSDLIRIGYFGIIRCEWSWEIIKNLASTNRFQITIAGASILDVDIKKESESINNINYLGSYRSPDDLMQLYNQVDLIWACYPSPKETNKRWREAQLICRSNRFYESCNFKKPLITFDGSGDSVDIKKYNIGLILGNKKDKEIINEINSIESNHLKIWSKNMENIPESVYVYSEHDKLKTVLENILK